NLPKKSNTKILHVRTHSSKSAYKIDGIKYGNGNLDTDTDELPNGDLMTKQCFWLNNDYILNQIIEKYKTSTKFVGVLLLIKQFISYIVIFFDPFFFTFVMIFTFSYKCN